MLSIKVHTTLKSWDKPERYRRTVMSVIDVENGVLVILDTLWSRWEGGLSKTIYFSVPHHPVFGTLLTQS